MSLKTEENQENQENQEIQEIKDWENKKLNLKSKLLRGIYAHGFENPSPIQQKSIYPMIKKYNGMRKDIIAQAQSGTGKTGAFTISTLQIIDETKQKTQAMILCPTHELARQAKDTVDSLGLYLKIHTKILIGGSSVDEDKEDLKNKCPQVVIGTPGRIHDMLRRNYLDSNNLKLLVIDEADEMLSEGFQKQMYKIFAFIPDDIQVALFSATMPTDLENLTKQFLRDPTKILVESEKLTLQGISQYFINLEDDIQKYETIKDLFANLSIVQAIIYCNSVRRVDDLAEAMTVDSFPVEKIHGRMTQNERKDIFKNFKEGNCRVLITSDLFARGIDVQQVSLVINFDIPKDEHTYLHRIGRSGRWGRKGTAINFQTKYDQMKLKKFREIYKTEITELPLNYTSVVNI
jgi:translation initiation factor 4A